MAYNLNATDMVYDFIVDKIRSGAWAPGKKIWSELELCQHTGVSRTAVRQAIEKLSALSVVSKKHGSGTYVNSIQTSSLSGLPFFQLDAASILSLLEFRQFFEVGNVQMFIEHADQKDAARLEQNYDEMCQHSHNPDKFFYLDNEFHNIIAKGTKNPYVIKVADSFLDILQGAQRGLYQNLGPQIGVEYHGYILEYIQKRDRELASIYMRRHIEMNVKALRERIAAGKA